MGKKYALHPKLDGIPAQGRARVRALCGFSDSVLKTLRADKKISHADYTDTVYAKKHSKTLLELADMLGIRSVDINRWDKDRRLPHAYKTRIKNPDGSTTLSRLWITTDIDYAAQHTLEWVESDIKHNIIHTESSVSLMLDHLKSIPHDYVPSLLGTYSQDFIERMQGTANALRGAYKNDRDAQKALDAAKRDRDIQDTKQRIAAIIEMAGDKHWDTLFHNKQLGARRIDAYLGPTNSGKTYTALQALKELRHGQLGVYLAPLRLLALEVCEELRSQGVPASLITGEEQDIDPNARVICSTIEMLDSTQYYDVAVIDEMQMIADTQRGWAWTRALFQLDADHIFALGSHAVKKLLEDFADTTGDTLDIHLTKRFTPLNVHDQPIFPSNLEKGTIFVVFSRNSVIQWGQYFRNNGHSVAQIYGAMPPEVRREEARRFRSGEADILVATDAVAMGLNLPAHTVVIGEYEKYDGESTAPVQKALVRQIAGRAGRFGFHDAGITAGTDVIIHKHIGVSLKTQDTPVTFPNLTVAPTPEWVDRVISLYPDIGVQDILQGWWYTVDGSKWFTCVDMTAFLEKAKVMDSVDGIQSLPMHERLQILTAPVNLRTGQLDNFRAMLRGIVSHEKIQTPRTPTGESVITDELESAYKAISLYCWFHYRYPHVFTEILQAEAQRSLCVDTLIDHIRKGLRRYCRSCGAPITTHRNVTMCRNCYVAYNQRANTY